MAAAVRCVGASIPPVPSTRIVAGPHWRWPSLADRLLRGWLLLLLEELAWQAVGSPVARRCMGRRGYTDQWLGAL